MDHFVTWSDIRHQISGAQKLRTLTQRASCLWKNILSLWFFYTGFAALKRLLANATALARPDFEKTFYVDVDSATVGGVGMVLTQREDELDPDTHKPLAFGSHKFNDNERAFTIRDQECFGLYKSLQQWRHLLLGPN